MSAVTKRATREARWRAQGRSTNVPGKVPRMFLLPLSLRRRSKKPRTWVRLGRARRAKTLTPEQKIEAQFGQCRQRPHPALFPTPRRKSRMIGSLR